MRITSARRGAAFVTLVFFPLLGAAADDPAQTVATPEAATEVDTIVVTGSGSEDYTVKDSGAATKLPMTLRETPQSVTVITRQRLEDQNLQSLRDVMDKTPGVYSYQYDTERVLFTSRGFVVDNLMYDGVPAVTNFNTDSIEDALDLSLYERIEIVRGATGLTTGAGSPAASVNLVRKHADSRKLATQVETTYGRWDDSRIEADVSTPLTADGNVRARVVGVYQNRESYQDLYESEKWVFYGIVDADLTPRTRVSLGYDHQNNTPQSNTWGSFPLYFSDGSLTNWSRSITTAADWSYWNRRYETAFGELRHQFDGGWTLRSTLSWRRFREHNQLFYVYGFPDPETGIIDTQSDPDAGYGPYAYSDSSKRIQRAVDVYASGPFSAFGREHELVVGYNGSRTTDDGVVYEPIDGLTDPVNLFEWDGSYPQPTFDSGSRLGDIRTTQQGVYAAGRFQIVDALKLVAGARYATWKIDSFYLYDTPFDSYYDYKKTIPYAGLIYDVSAQFSLFTSYTEIFKPQNSKDANGSYLDPIDGRSYEVGIKGEHFGGRFNSALTFFRTLQDNVAEPVLDEDGNVVQRPDGSDVTQPIDGTVSRGFEFELAGRIVDGWNAQFGWTRYLIDDADDRNVRTFVPRTLVRAFTTYTPRGALNRLTVGGGVDWQSESNTQVASPDGGATFRQGDVTLVSLLARWQFTRDVALQVNGNNLLDKKYYVLDEFDNTYYGAPMSASASLRVNF